MNIKKIVNSLIKEHNSNNPFDIADNLNIVVIYSDMKDALGFFNMYRRIKFIHLSSYIPEELKMFVCAHELGHAILHPDINTPFLRQNTLFSIDKIECQANLFGVEMLLTDRLLNEYSECNFFNVAKSVGIPDKLAHLKLERFQHQITLHLP